MIAYNVAVDVGGTFTDVAIGDHSLDAHNANLYDIDSKYGDVVSVEETLEYLEEKHATRVS